MREELKRLKALAVELQQSIERLESKIDSTVNKLKEDATPSLPFEEFDETAKEK